MRTWSSGQIWGESSIGTGFANVRATEGERELGGPGEQLSRSSQPLQSNDPRLTTISGKFMVELRSEPAGFPIPQSRWMQARKDTTWPSLHKPGPPSNKHTSHALSTRFFSQLLWKVDVWPNTLRVCVCMHVHVHMSA